MPLKFTLLNHQSPGWESTLANSISHDPTALEELIQCLFSGESRLCHRATLVILEVAKLNPSWLQEQIPRVVENLSHDLPDWYKRNLLRILQNYPIPPQVVGQATDLCFSYLSALQESVAVKVFSMSVLSNICREHPELARELRLLIEDQYPTASAGFKARARKVLKDIDRMGS